MSATKLPYGKPVKLLVDCQGFADGRLVLFEIWRNKGGKEEKVSDVYGVTKEGKARGRWIPLIEREEVLPLQEKITERVEEEKYYFIAKIDDQEAKSGDMVFTYPLDISLQDIVGKPVDGVKYTVTFSDGSKKEGEFKNGHAKFEDAPTGKFKIELEDYELVIEENKVKMALVNAKGEPLSNVECEITFKDRQKLTVKSDGSGILEFTRKVLGEFRVKLLEEGGTEEVTAGG